MPQVAGELHLTHRPGMADVLHRGDLRRDRVAVISLPPLTVGQLPRAAHEQLRHRGQPLPDGRRLIPSRLTHHLDELTIRHTLEHTFDYATPAWAAAEVIHRPFPVPWKTRTCFRNTSAAGCALLR